ncbi:hypothetical protein HPB48_019363 [Haemaphysalis longicornis]|uniref:Uncharacterized protein n=1 Tax=Haemaphysalis longicornis TaxID=44386 RepID=A0A9J6G3V6_HAELO|nr:hypothetical protein HPB48_019363 [Haemaphysalis longicornis]
MAPRRRWVAALAALTTLMTTTTNDTGLSTEGEEPPRPLHDHTAEPLVAESMRNPAFQKRAKAGWAQHDPQTVAQVVLTAATLSALVLGASCYAWRNRKQHEGRHRYSRLAGEEPDKLRTLRLSPIGPSCRRDRHNWASISLVNLLSSYPATPQNVADAEAAARDGADAPSETSDAT